MRQSYSSDSKTSLPYLANDPHPRVVKTSGGLTSIVVKLEGECCFRRGHRGLGDLSSPFRSRNLHALAHKQTTLCPKSCPKRITCTYCSYEIGQKSGHQSSVRHHLTGPGSIRGVQWFTAVNYSTAVILFDSKLSAALAANRG